MARSTADFKSNTTKMQKQKKKFEYGMDYQITRKLLTGCHIAG